MSIEAGSRLTLDVEKPAAGGRMLARHQGEVVLIAGAIPGERVVVDVERRARGVVYGRVVEVLSPSADRRGEAVESPCGGSAYAYIRYQRQLQLKADIIGDAFARLARLPLAAPPGVVASPETGFRMRARLHARGPRLGFYREGSHQLCDASDTGQLAAATVEWIASAQALLRANGAAGLIAVDVAENVAGDQRACHLEVERGARLRDFAVLASDLTGLSAGVADTRGAATIIAGTPVVSDVLHARVGDATSALRLRRTAHAFFQGNRHLLEPLLRHVLAHVADGPVIDLYAGVGLFGLSRAAAGAETVTLVEGDPVSGEDLAGNAEAFGARVAVVRRSVESFLDRTPAQPTATVIVDPPRTGLSRQALAGILRLTAPRVVYVSCDVATLARDVRSMHEAGYRLANLTGLDLFPNTAHIEAVAVLDRSPAERSGSRA